jgi:hypothetical protein
VGSSFAALYHDLFGGELLAAEVSNDGRLVEWHMWNRLPGGLEVDLTRDQSRDGEVVGAPTVRPRTPEIARPDHPRYHRYEAYLVLASRVRQRLPPAHNLNPVPFERGAWILITVPRQGYRSAELAHHLRALADAHGSHDFAHANDPANGDLKIRLMWPTEDEALAGAAAYVADTEFGSAARIGKPTSRPQTFFFTNVATRR